jgi:hypothetical protein
MFKTDFLPEDHRLKDHDYSTTPESKFSPNSGSGDTPKPTSPKSKSATHCPKAEPVKVIAIKKRLKQVGKNNLITFDLR